MAAKLFLGLMVLWFNGVIVPVMAITNPITATSSATATIPALSVTGDNDPPTPPILIRPQDGSTTTHNHPVFVWQRSTDPDGNTILYTLYLNGVATYLGIADSSNSAGAGYSARVEGDEVHLTPSGSLSDGRYAWYVTATDLSDNTSFSQIWHFIVDTGVITSSPTPSLLPSSYPIPYTPYTIPSLPATISLLRTTTDDTTLLYIGLLALAIFVLLIFIWKRRYNLLILDMATGKPIDSLTLYHSVPTKRLSRSAIFVTTLPPLSYQLSPPARGRLLIRSLGRYSTLTIRLGDLPKRLANTTHILSLSASRRTYTIEL